MGIQSTAYVSRETCIDRIREIFDLVKNKNYRKIDEESFESDYDVKTFVDSDIFFDMFNIEKWSDVMLEDVMDEPFFRYSMFDNYLIGEKE